jgi:hypothetical protein
MYYVDQSTQLCAICDIPQEAGRYVAGSGQLS